MQYESFPQGIAVQCIFSDTSIAFIKRHLTYEIFASPFFCFGKFLRFCEVLSVQFTQAIRKSLGEYAGDDFDSCSAAFINGQTDRAVKSDLFCWMQC